VENQRIVVNATGDLLVGADRISPSIQCGPRDWPGSALLFDTADHRFVVERSTCLPRR
jgi:hypothetical protein